MDRYGELFEATETVREQLAPEGKHGWSFRRIPPPKMGAIAALMVVGTVIAAIVVGTHDSMPSPQGASPATAPSKSRPIRCDESEYDAATCFMHPAVPWRRAAQVPAPTVVHVFGSKPFNGRDAIFPTSSCTAYPNGTLHELGPYRDQILAEYERAAGEPRSDECVNGYVFWLPASLFP